RLAAGQRDPRVRDRLAEPGTGAGRTDRAVGTADAREPRQGGAGADLRGHDPHAVRRDAVRVLLLEPARRLQRDDDAADDDRTAGDLRPGRAVAERRLRARVDGEAAVLPPHSDERLPADGGSLDATRRR